MSTNGHGTIHDNTLVDCRYASTHIASIRISDHFSTLRKRCPSLPPRPTAAAPMARFCGEIILPSTPPELFDAAINVADRCALCAAVTCSAPNSEFDDVSDPVM